MTADPRLTAATEFLQHIRSGPKPSALPRIRIDREDAELRRQLGQVLDVVTEVNADLTQAVAGLDEARPLLGQALADAAAYREQRAVGMSCEVCDSDPEALCGEHEGDLELADAYTALGRGLGIEVDR